MMNNTASSKQLIPRNFENIYIHKETYECATIRKCIPCMYKIHPNAYFYDENNNIFKLLPNKRPETCMRSKSVTYNGIYNSSYRVLTIGDGDFSFSLSLARHFNKKCHNKLIATSHESLQSLYDTYPDFEVILSELNSLGVSIYHEIDASNLSEDIKKLKFNRYDKIIWNFPCVRIDNGNDGQTSELEQNVELLTKFFNQVKSILISSSYSQTEIHITHKTIEPFCWWNIIDIARSCGYMHCGSIIFDRYVS